MAINIAWQESAIYYRILTPTPRYIISETRQTNPNDLIAFALGPTYDSILSFRHVYCIIFHLKHEHEHEHEHVGC